MKSYLDKVTGQRAAGRPRVRVGGFLLGAWALGAGACTGSLGNGNGMGMTGSGNSGVTGNGGSSGSGGTGMVMGDVNRVAIHRLNNQEYDYTVRELLGVATTGARTFINDESILGFDTIADAFGMTPAQYEQYFNAADTLVDQAFADATLRGKIMSCMPTGAADTACLTKIITTFGLRAWRRPLTDAEAARLVKLATPDSVLGDDAIAGVKVAIKGILSSLPFLYRLEIDADPKSMTARPLNGYELASRLSYLTWSTMPDDQLFSLAQTGELVKQEVLSAQLDRLLSDEKASRFVSSFAGQWLGMRDLEAHQVDMNAFPGWNEPLRQAMVQEGLLYFQEFLSGARPMRDFLTADVNFVSGPLGELYGMSGAPAAGQPPMKISDTTDARRGFMGLASFLTFSSFPYRTAPTLRGKWVLANLLCETLPPPPPTVPELDDKATMMMAQSQNVRLRLEAHRSNPDCASCHAVLDPIGLGLENFDAVGRYRTKYLNGDSIDSSGVLPDKSTFKNLAELTTLLSNPADTRLIDCASKTVMTYALSRGVVASDSPYLEKIRQTWKGGDVKTLLREIVLADTFRQRRGDPN